jgi:hypothetical protein
MRPHVDLALALAALLAAALANVAMAQDDPVPPPPRLDRPPEPVLTNPPVPLPGTTAIPTPPVGLRPPNAALLAPLPEDRPGAPDEIVVVGHGWRLPDLGSEWRKRQEEAADTGRFHVTFLPLYDPSRPPQRDDSLFANPEFQRQGYIELFRMRFGHRARP